MEIYDHSNPKMLGNWFDPFNDEHICEFMYLNTHAHWSPEFYEKMKNEGVIIHQLWQAVLYSKMGECWVKYRIEEMKRTQFK